jgi:signal transduction histidine kinase
MGSSAETPYLIIYIVAGIGIMILLVLSVLIYVNRAQRFIFKQQLEIKDMETQHKENLLNNSILVLEEERKRIAKDLHDEIGSLFSALRLKINQIEIPAASAVKDAILESRDLIDSGLQSARRISHNMIPPGLDMFGLPDTLEGLCDQFSTPTLDVHFSFKQNYRKLPQNSELGIYRIAQELLNNSVKHANATKIRIQLHQSDAQTELDYSDNGKGFDFDQVYHSAQSGLGLRNIEARVNHIKGTLRWDTKPGAGFAVHISLPD